MNLQKSLFSQLVAKRFSILLIIQRTRLRLIFSTYLYCLGIVLTNLIALGDTVSAAVLPPTPIVVSGTPAPAGGEYLSFPWSPVINNAGQVAFQVYMQGTSSSGIVSGFPNSLATVALAGTASPSGGFYDALIGTNTPVINSAGQVAYFANLDTGTSPSGIFAGTPGSVQTYALQGTASPSGPPYSNLTEPTINSSGQLAFHAILNGFPSRGIFTGLPGSIQTVAASGAAAPGGGNFSLFGSPAINASGTVAFSADLTGTSPRGIFIGTPGSVGAVARVGTIAPAGGNYSGFGSPVINAAGQVAYIGQLTGEINDSGIFSGLPGSIQAIALEDTPAPSGGNFVQVSNPVINATGQVAFRSTLMGGSANNGIFTGTFGALQTVVLQGQLAPDGIGNFSSLETTVSLNSNGQIAFLSSLNGAGVTSANDRGLYAYSEGSLIQIVREGDIIDIDPGLGIDNRTVTQIGFSSNSGGEDGRRTGLNDSGWLVYRLSFTNGSGIFITQIQTVPEPSTVGLVSAGLLGFFIWMRMRSNSSE